MWTSSKEPKNGNSCNPTSGPAQAAIFEHADSTSVGLTEKSSVEIVLTKCANSGTKSCWEMRTSDF